MIVFVDGCVGGEGVKDVFDLFVNLVFECMGFEVVECLIFVIEGGDFFVGWYGGVVD